MDILLKTFLFNRIVTLSFIIFPFILNAQEGVFIDFEDSSEADGLEHIILEQRGIPDYTVGIKGNAWDLSMNSDSRFPIEYSGDYSFLKDEFSVILWVKKDLNSKGDNLIAGNMNPNKKGKGWVIKEQKNGSWAVVISDSTHTFEYEPTVPRQNISDNQWHLLGMTFSKYKMEARFYFDGVNVGIYNLAGLNPDIINEKLFLGGYKTEEHTFTGLLDGFKLYRGIKDSEFYRKGYQVLKDPAPVPTFNNGDELKIMAWNIWHGGREHGEQAGVSRVVDVIKESGADIIGMIETYQSGEIISDSLGYYFYLISSNLSIMSKYPIEDHISVYKPFNSGGAMIRLNKDTEIAFFDIWLHYLPSYGSRVKRKGVPADSLILEEGKTRHAEVKAILSEITEFTDNSDNTPVFMVGDYNSGSHLDWVEKAKEIHNGYVVKWPVSLEMEKAGMIDSYRTKYPNPLKYQGRTWSPIFTNATQDRIDYVYHKGKSLQLLESKMLDQHPVKWPSDHSAVISTYKIK